MDKNKMINPQNLTNVQLDKLLDECDWCDRELLKEHDARLKDGRIKTIRTFHTKEELEEYFQKRRLEKERQKKKAS